MIDPHVHLRDWNQAHKETLRHGFSVAWRAGLDGVFEMPNTDPPLTSRPTIQRRIRDADSALRGLGIPLFHGLYAGLTADPLQIAEAVQAWREFFPRVVGLKMFAGHSTGNMGIVDREAQAGVYRTLAGLGFTGVLAVHCEKESMLRPEAWDPGRPSSHGRARPPAAEVASVDDQVELAREADFRGTLHVCHISTPWALDVLRGTHAPSLPESAPPRPLRVSCGLTPHHALLDIEMMDAPDGVLLKMNPPLRPRPLPEKMLGRLLASRHGREKAGRVRRSFRAGPAAPRIGDSRAAVLSPVRRDSLPERHAGGSHRGGHPRRHLPDIRHFHHEQKARGARRPGRRIRDGRIPGTWKPVTTSWQERALRVSTRRHTSSRPHSPDPSPRSTRPASWTMQLKGPGSWPAGTAPHPRLCRS
jgi:dihydroorotase